MTENTFPFNDTPDEVDAPAPNRRNLLLAGGLAAALLIGGGGYYLLSGSSGDTATAVAAHAPRPAVAAPKLPTKTKTKATAKVLTVAPVAKVPAKSTEHLGRDPFKALYVQPVAAVAGLGGPAAGPLTAIPGPTGTKTGTTGTSTGTKPGTTGTSTGTTGTGTGSTPVDASAPYALQLVSISPPSPEVRLFAFKVAGVSKTVLPAQRFGKYGELIVLAYTKTPTGAVTGALIQVGDDSPIDVRLGEKITVL